MEISYPNTLSSRRDYRRGVLLVLTAGLCWSIGGLVVRLIENANEWQIVFVRSLGLISTLLLFLGWRHGRDVTIAFKKAGLNAVLAGLFLGAAFACWIFALTHTTVASALFVLASQPFFAALLAWVLLRERVVLATWGFMSLAAIGIGVMVTEGIANGTVMGNLFALGAAFGFAVFAVILRRGKEVDMTPAVFWAGVWATLISTVVLFITQQRFVVSPYDTTLCLTLGVVQVGMGLIIFTAGSRHVPAAELTLLGQTETVLGVLWVWVLIGEQPGYLTLLGGAIVLVAIVSQAIYGIQKDTYKAI